MTNKSLCFTAATELRRYTQGVVAQNGKES
jgi:hypothetical protein